MNRVQMKLEYDKIKEEFKDVHEIIDQGDSVVLRFDDEGTEACVTDKGSLYFQVSTDVDRVKSDFENQFPSVADRLLEDVDDGFWIFDETLRDFNLIKRILRWLKMWEGEK